MNLKYCMDNQNSLTAPPQYKYLHFVPLPKFTLWDVKNYLDTSIESDFPVVQLKNVLKTVNSKGDFTCDKTLLLPDFLSFLLNTSTFKTIIQTEQKNLGQHNLRYNTLKSLQIPLPPLEVQKQLSGVLMDKILTIKKQEEDCECLENQMADYFLNELSLIKREEKKKPIFHFVNFSDMKRWDISNTDTQYESVKYPFKRLEDIILGTYQYGSYAKSISLVTDIRYIRIADINKDGSLNALVFSAEKTDEQYLLTENDFLIARIGSGTIGKTFLYKSHFGKAIFSNHLVRFKLDIAKIHPDYLLYYTQSNIFKNWVKLNQKGSVLFNIDGQEFLNAPIIVPDLNTQKTIIDTIFIIKEKMENLKQLSHKNTMEAFSDFEKVVFKTKL